MFSGCSQNVLWIWIFSGCSQNALRVFLGCSWDALRMFSECPHDFFRMFLVCPPPSHLHLVGKKSRKIESWFLRRFFHANSLTTWWKLKYIKEVCSEAQFLWCHIRYLKSSKFPEKNKKNRWNREWLTPSSWKKIMFSLRPKRFKIVWSWHKRGHKRNAQREA